MTLLPDVVGVPIWAAVNVISQPVAVKVLLLGQEIVGAPLEVTTILCVQLAERANGSEQSGGSLHSLAVQVMVVVPTG